MREGRVVVDRVAFAEDLDPSVDGDLQRSLEDVVELLTLMVSEFDRKIGLLGDPRRLDDERLRDLSAESRASAPPDSLTIATRIH